MSGPIGSDLLHTLFIEAFLQLIPGGIMNAIIKGIVVLLLAQTMIGCGDVTFSDASGMQKLDGLSSEGDGIADDDDDATSDDGKNPWHIPGGGVVQGVKEECDQIRKEEASTPVRSGTVSIVKSFGALVIKANHIDRIEESSGAVIVLGEGSNARIDRIHKHHGAMVLCNVNVGTVTDSFGAVGIYGDVTDVINHTGAFEVSGKVLGKVENHNGAFVEGSN